MRKGVVVFLIVVLFFGSSPLFAGSIYTDISNMLNLCERQWAHPWEEINSAMVVSEPDKAQPCYYGRECGWYWPDGDPVWRCRCLDGWLK